MAVLVIFAVLAGAGTALTPCVLPVLPALLSASASGGRRRPAGRRLYRLVSMPEVGEPDLRLRLPPGVSAYTFTFG